MSTPVNKDDSVMDALRALPTRDVPAVRANEIRGRCAATLVRRSRRKRSLNDTWARWHARIEPATVAAMSALFLFEVVRRALLLF